MYHEIFHPAVYSADPQRYSNDCSRKVGERGLSLPLISLGFYHYFGMLDPYAQMKEVVLCAFDHGIFHFDNADCYGPPNGEAERNLGKIISQHLRAYRDELVVATKGGFDSFLGPNGEGGSRKHLMAAIDNSLRNLGLDYVDIYYHHVQDLTTPLEETADALADIVKRGKALYIGISNYDDQRAEQLISLLEQKGVPPILGQYQYNMLHREIEKKTLPMLRRHGMGAAAYVPLAQGFLTDRYLKGNIKITPRADQMDFALPDSFSDDIIRNLQSLNEIAAGRHQTLA